MVQTCSRCSRANPQQAVYCYHDGMVLDRERAGGPVAVGAQQFGSPFVFPNGRACRTFNELARACQEEWTTARDLLEKGYLETFFGGLGRLDLAGAAREAGKFPDHDRGLDQLLGKLPGDILAEPKLRVDPLNVNLGVLEAGQDLDFELHLENQGERLVYGSVTCTDGIWLAVGGDSAGATTPEKHFQFNHELTIPVKVRGDKLQARVKPHEARLVVDSNGGRHTITVRAEVPIKPFPSGALAGAKTPRELAQKCQASPKETAPFFESGEVERWYQSNGWTYPVKIPSASGLAALQQFFEALGMTKPPRVEVSTEAIALEAEPGDTLNAAVEVSTPEKKFVFAHGTSDQPWLEVSRAKFSGRVCTIAMSVPSVPNRPGQTLTARLTVQANGNQKFVIPVSVAVAGSGFDFVASEVVEEPAAADEVGVTLIGDDEGEGDGDLTLVPPPPKPRTTAPAAPRNKRPARQGTPVWLHAVPAVLLLLAVLGVVVFDLLLGGGKAGEKVEAGGSGASAEGWNYDVRRLRAPEPRIGVDYRDDNRFGLVMLDMADPKNKDKAKKLTASNTGDGNNTTLKIDGYEYIFGFTTPNNQWVAGLRRKDVPTPRQGRMSVMLFKDEKIRVMQHVEIVPSDTGLLDTCLVYYEVKNTGTVPHKVGLRVLLDTYIGNNDGVPFTVPGEKGFVTDQKDFNDSAVPDYIEAVEDPDNEKNPGTVVRLGLKGIRLPGITLEDPDKLRISRWPGNNAKWEWDPQNMDTDSSVAVYWPYEELKPGAVRRMAYTYGLGQLDIGDQLALSAPPATIPGREFVVTGYVFNAKKGQKVRLELPDGMTLGSGESAEKAVDADAKRAQVSWRVKATKPDSFKLEATSNGGRSRPRVVEVRAAGLFG